MLASPVDWLRIDRQVLLLLFSGGSDGDDSGDDDDLILTALTSPSEVSSHAHIVALGEDITWAEDAHQLTYDLHLE